MWELVWEAFHMGICAIGVGYGLHYYAYKRGMQDEFDVVNTKALKKDASGKKKDYKTGNGFLDKWLDFGGGYYGVIAMIKLIFIELEQIKDFIADWQGLSHFIGEIGIAMLVNFFIEQIMNFVAAISWPADYFGRFSFEQVAIFFVVTYVCYNVSRKLARNKIDSKTL